MRVVRNILLCLALAYGFTGISQDKNVFHERSFWKENPSLETVKQKVKEGHDPTALNENAFDAVIYALLEQTNDEVVTYLLTLDRNSVSKKTHDSRIYLHWAAYAGRVNMVRLLLEKGSATTALDSNGSTPLVFAANAWIKDPALYDLFEKHGVVLTQETSKQGANLLLLAAPSLTTAADLDFFLNKGFDLQATDTDGNGIFNYASKKGNIDFLNALIDKGVDYKSLNKQGGNAFLFAAQGMRGHSNALPVYRFLKDKGLNPAVVTQDGNTALHRLAASNTDLATINFFLEAGTSVNQQDASGNTPFLIAAARNKLPVINLLFKHLDNINTVNNDGASALMLAVQRNSPDVVRFLLEQGGDAFAKDKQGNTIAFYLLQSFDAKNPEPFNNKLNLLASQDVSITTTQSGGNTPLHLAALENNLDLLKRLAVFTIDINAKNKDGLTALHIAAMKAQNVEILKHLIAQGADHTIKTDFEETAHQLATDNELLQKQNISLQFLK